MHDLKPFHPFGNPEVVKDQIAKKDEIVGRIRKHIDALRDRKSGYRNPDGSNPQKDRIARMEEEHDMHVADRIRLAKVHGDMLKHPIVTATQP